MLVDILLLNHVWVKLFYFDCDSLQFSSVTKLCLILCDPMDCSMPGFPVHHQLSEFTQTHVHWVSDAIQPSQPPSSPSPPTFNLSQHQGLFKRVSSSHQVAKVKHLEPCQEHSKYSININVSQQHLKALFEDVQEIEVSLASLPLLMETLLGTHTLKQEQV